MLRLVPLFLALVFAEPAAHAVGFGVSAGLFTPTQDVKDLLNSQWQVGLRFVLPPYTPIGVLPIPGLALDVGTELAVAEGLQKASNAMDTRLLNVTALYRFSLPVSQSLSLYGAWGGRFTGLWGDMAQQLRDGSLWEHLRAAMVAAGGFDWSISPGLVIDARIGTGLWGFTAWQADIALIILG